MRAVVFNKFGGSNVLQFAEVAKPEIEADEVLIKISNTSVNPVDWKIREGYLKDLFPHNFPIIPGWDVSGKIEAIGASVTGFELGDLVFAYARKPEVGQGTYAEYISLKADAVSKIPRGITLGEAAALPLVGLTAWQALFEFAELKEGDTVFVTGGSGGVGSLAIQFAKYKGAKVITAASKANHDYLISLGADKVIDYRNETVIDEVLKFASEGVDIVFDTVGGKSLKDGFEVIKTAGRLVSIVDAPDATNYKTKNLKTGFIFVAPNGKQLGEIAEAIESGEVQLPAIQQKSIKQAAEIQDLNRQGHVRGKIVLNIDF